MLTLNAAARAVLYGATTLLAWAISPVHAQTPTTASKPLVIRGMVVDAASGSPLAYAVVSTRQSGARDEERKLTDRAGEFRISIGRVGQVQLDVRRIGFRPETVTVNPAIDSGRVLRIAMRHLAVSLPAIAVRANDRCDDPGPPQPADDSALAAVFDQLRQNAIQYRLIAREQPFTLWLDRRATQEEANGTITELEHDTVAVRSDADWEYQPSHVVEFPSSDPRHAVVHIPSLETFADSTFLALHCFFGAGVTHEDGRTLLVVGFRPAESISAADVEGSAYIDSATYQLWRESFHLSRPPRNIGFIRAVDVSTTFAGVFPDVFGVDSIESTTWYAPWEGMPIPKRRVETRHRIAVGKGSSNK